MTDLSILSISSMNYWEKKSILQLVSSTLKACDFRSRKHSLCGYWSSSILDILKYTDKSKLDCKIVIYVCIYTHIYTSICVCAPVRLWWLQPMDCNCGLVLHLKHINGILFDWENNHFNQLKMPLKYGMSFEMLVLNMHLSWKLLLYYLDFESSSDT